MCPIGHRVCPTCLGAGHIWENYWVDTMQHWTHRLSTERNIDSAAMTDWCTLYAASPFRKSQALEVLHKILKKEHGGVCCAEPQRVHGDGDQGRVAPGGSAVVSDCRHSS